MKVAEIYPSIQGEGNLTGTESVFIRASGCNLRCSFCDTPFASWQPEGEDLSVSEIVGRVMLHHPSHVVITGGEPMLFSEMIPLCDAFAEQGYHITIETAGTLYLPLRCDLMSISPKLANSTPSLEQAGRWSERHERSRYVPNVLRQLIRQYAYQLKFVVGTPGDAKEVLQYLDQLRDASLDRANVWLMPQAINVQQMRQVASWLEAFCQANKLRYCPRKQLEWFGLRRGT